MWVGQKVTKREGGLGGLTDPTNYELEDGTKGSENPVSRSFWRIFIGIWTALRIGAKDLDAFLPTSTRAGPV